jgi:hypothetical protein
LSTCCIDTVGRSLRFVTYVTYGPGSGGGTTPRNCYGLTNAEDFKQAQSARVVHIISTPYDKANPVAGRIAVETKALHDDPAQGVYVFNPNTGLRRRRIMAKKCY